MNPDLAEPMSQLVDELKRLPGVGPKSAQRIAFHLLGVNREEAQRLADAVTQMREKIQLCIQCNNIAEGDLCPICRDPTRDRTTVCVLEQPNNIMVVERTRQYSGLYHVLHGVISPLRNMAPEDLKVKNLLERLKDGEVEEIILATSPTTEGQATAAYLIRLLKPLGVSVSRIGMGIPVGSELEFIDEATMVESIEGRRKV
ncbi:MAG: recombination mediator RecR [Acidobacteria bacterium]|nr:recombination mediator RecR [Acidobacteriota bacterium]MDA1234357.1 recombination mediator RecR [Acidobacteriota bacterium]